MAKSYKDMAVKFDQKLQAVLFLKNIKVCSFTSLKLIYVILKGKSDLPACHGKQVCLY